MKRTLLYYPSINIPTDEWLRPAILYSDEIGSILPFDMTNADLGEDLKLLHEEGEYRPFYFNEQLSISLPWVEEFNESFVKALNSTEFQSLSGRQLSPAVPREADSYQMYLLKLTQRVKWELYEKGLLKLDRTNDEMLQVDLNTAALYMSLLAQYLAANDLDNYVIPTTNQAAFERAAVQLTDNIIPCSRLVLNNCLPVPDPKVPIKTIISFKRRRRNELLALRQIIDDVQKAINEADTVQALTLTMVQFGESIERNVHDIELTMKEERIGFVSSYLSSLLNVRKPEVLLAVGAGTLAGVLTAQPLIGLAAGGAIKLVNDFVSSYLGRRKAERNSPYSYLIHARQSGVLR